MVRWNVCWLGFWLGLIWWVSLVLGDNFHSLSNGRVVCNGEIIADKCADERWKISYLGTDENIQIYEYRDVIYIEGAIKTDRDEVHEQGSIYFPKGYRLVLHSDRVFPFLGGTPDKVVKVGITILGMLVFSLASYKVWGSNFQNGFIKLA
ncbi:hypothetical protein NEHOM01_1091 [Nematocida homosporus]|uniref:uncharacterized protein n=1 Tax=Nematocida homosporus TaxID=1912981 RepID=UPI00221ECB48|nr:uncharacterized protein NEHOM01_1091 [Nematocida homosporus]KAI5185814.1 hypothetical protein NEHOM01_1091 [Nematocida homosporus]